MNPPSSSVGALRLTSVNVGEARPVTDKDGSRITGIFKIPTAGLARVSAEGLPGDAICAKQHHGGPDQAIYVYGQIDYDWWERELGRRLEPGLFGENFTMAGVESASWTIGDRLRVGTVILEVTAARIPCGNFAARMGDPDFVKRFRAAERPGFYCRVVQEGEVRAGDEAVREVFGGQPRITVLETFRDYYAPELTKASIRRFLDAPIAIRMRAKKQKQLEALGAG